MQVEKLTSDSEHLFPDCDNFSGSNHSNFILGIVGLPYMLPRLLKNIYSMCTHQAHMGFDLKKNRKNPQNLAEISACAVWLQIFIREKSSLGLYIELFGHKIFSV